MLENIVNVIYGYLLYKICMSKSKQSNKKIDVIFEYL